MQWRKRNSKPLCLKEPGLNHLFHKKGVTKSGGYLFHKGKVKAKVIPLQARAVWPRGWVEVQLYSSMTAALEGGKWSAARPGCTLSPGKTRYPFTGAGWAPGPVWTGEKFRPNRNSIPDRPYRSSVAMPTELPGPLFHKVTMCVM